MNASKLKLALQFLHEEPQAAAYKLELESAQLAAAMLLKVPTTVAANVMRYMQPVFAAATLTPLTDAKIVPLLDELDLAHTAAILRQLDEPDYSRILTLLPLKKQTLCKMLVNYPDYTIGAWVETNVLILDSQMLINDAALRLKKRQYAGESSIYVVNHQRQVVGKLSVYDVISRPSHHVIEDIMSPVVELIGGYSELSSALDLAIWLRFDSAAVINRKREFIGVIHHHRIRTLLSRQNNKKPARHQPISSSLMEAFTATMASIFDLVSVK